MSKLLETLLKSEFKFGFELEAYVSSDVIEKYTTKEPYYDEENYDEDTFDGYQYDNDEPYSDELNTDLLYADLSEYFSEYFGKNLSVIEDGSLDSENGGFEFPSPPMNLTPLNIKECIKFLYNLRSSKWGIYTDDSCGFHTHISFPQMSNIDMCWIMCHIALNEKYQNEFMSFKATSGKEFDFFGQFATTDYLQDIESAIRTENWEELSKWLTNDKYRLIRIHPQGTLEWRGPRNFLNENNLQTIKDFFIKLLKVVSIIIEIMDKKEINGISKGNFFNLINASNLEERPIKNYINDSTYKAIIKNPLILTKINNSYSVSWYSFIVKLHRLVSNKNINFDDFLIPLRYKKFNNENLLSNIIKQSPNFIYYTVNNLNNIIKYLDNKTILYYLNSKNLNTELLFSMLKNENIYLVDILNVMLNRLVTSKSIDIFFNKNILNLIKEHMINSYNIQSILSYASEHPSYEPIFLKFYNLLS